MYVPPQALCLDGPYGCIPGTREGGPTRVIGYFQRVGRNWSIVSQYEAPGHVLNLETKHEQKMLFVVRDGKVEIEYLPTE
jgi:hypothetical protein